MKVGDSARGEELLVNNAVLILDVLAYTETVQIHVPYL